ncbi:subtilisin-like protein [Lactarius pseudohatsudake]|nr:subtilisin-like protein [Lactarius pseudohatsudake]
MSCSHTIKAFTPFQGNLTLNLTSQTHDIVSHSWNAVPEDWQSLGQPPPGTTIDPYIALKSHHEDDTLYEAYPPHGGNTLTLKDVSITQANALLNATYQLSSTMGPLLRRDLRTVGYALPAGLHRHVLTVAPTTSFFSPPPRMQWHAPRNGPDGEAVGPVRAASGEPVTMLSSREEIDAINPSFGRAVQLAQKRLVPALAVRHVHPLTRFDGQEYRSDAEGATFTVTQVNNGGYDPEKPAEESSLDVQYAEAMARLVPLLSRLLPQGASKIYPRRYCIEEKTASLGYSVYVCNLFGKLGLLGVSALYATCDDGVGKDCCTLSDGTIRFKPKFPASCPYVTAVGGTMDYDPEVGASFSSGGFSDHFKLPRYQRRVVPTFLQNLGNKHQGLYNASGRGFPDISAQSIGFPIFVNGEERERFTAQAAQHLYVFSFSLPSGPSVLEHPTPPSPDGIYQTFFFHFRRWMDDPVLM